MDQKKKSNVLFSLAGLSLIGFAFVSAGCSGSSANSGTPPVNTVSTTDTPIIIMETETSTPVVISSPSSGSTVVITPEISLTSTPDTRLDPFYWREWPVSPDLSPKAQEMLLSAKNNPALDLYAFSKVGDCQMTSATFLGGFANGAYAIPAGFEETVVWFSDSMTGESITAANGLGISSVLNPMFGLAAGNTQCQQDETPLDCELRTRRPAVVLIAMGTNWAPNAEVSFDKYLRMVVDRILETGALPLLATKADNIEGNWKLDQAIAQVAFDYDLPLVNVWRSVQDLPNHGLESPKNIYLTGDGWMRGNYAWLNILEKVRQVLAK